jgi:hypothetical protein
MFGQNSVHSTNSNSLTALLVHILTSFFDKLRASIFVCSQCLIAKYVCKLFSSKCGISHSITACIFDVLSIGSVLGPKSYLGC